MPPPLGNSLRAFRGLELAGLAAALILLGAASARADCGPCLEGKRACRQASVGEFKGCKTVCQFRYKGDRNGRAACVSACKKRRDEVQRHCLEKGRECSADCAKVEDPTCLRECGTALPECLRPIEERRKQIAMQCRRAARDERRLCRKARGRKICNQDVTGRFGECLSDVGTATSTDVRDCLAAVGVCVERCAKRDARPDPAPTLPEPGE
jgi:hypothetical protein